MGIPQGPGTALKFLTDEPSTCFTPNFEEVNTVSSRAERHFAAYARSRAVTADFEFSSSAAQTVGDSEMEF